MKAPFPLLPLLVLFLFVAGCSASRPAVPQRAIPAAAKSSGAVAGEPAVDPAAGGPASQESAAAPSPEAAPASAAPAVQLPPQPFDPGRIPVATVGGEEISLAELLSTWVQSDSQGVHDLLERLVYSRLVAREARRQGIEVDPTRVREEYARTLSGMEEKLRLQQPGMDLDQWITEGLGLDPLEYRSTLEQEVKRRLYAERVVRTFTFSQEWADVRILVVETQEVAQAAMTRIRAGEPFGRLAAELSIDPGGKRGGRLPPVLRNESTLSRLAFDTKTGEMGGPILVEGRWMVIQTDEIHAPLLGDWGELAPRIETSLNERPIEDPEYWMWKTEMQTRHPVDFGPFLELVGQTGRAESEGW